MYVKRTNFGFKKANLHKALCMLHLTGMRMACIKYVYSYTVKGLQIKCTKLHFIFLPITILNQKHFTFF